MQTAVFRSILLVAALCGLAALPAAGDASAQPAAVAALGWLVLLVWGGHRLLRRRIAAEDRATELAAQLCIERKARVRAEQALADSHGVLRKVVRKQGRVRDGERARIARDIHDDLGQTLLALRIELSLLQVQTSGMHPALHHRLGTLVGTLDHAIRSLRAVINDLRPLGLDEGLRRAIERQLGEFSRITGIAHEFSATASALDDAERSRAIDALLYRVLQEALSNVARHAQASRVRVTLGRAGERVVLRVEDDGIGIGEDGGQRGCGLAGMRERAGAEGGELQVSSRPGGGTALALSVPLSPLPVAG